MPTKEVEIQAGAKDFSEAFLRCKCSISECKVSCPYVAVNVAGELIITFDVYNIDKCSTMCCNCTYKEAKIIDKNEIVGGE